jgi:hypothetical protein
MMTEDERRRVVIEAMASFALEGMLPTPQDMIWAEALIKETMTPAEIRAEILKKYNAH